MADPQIDPNDPILQPLQIPEKPLAGHKALVVGIANKDSIAYGIARALRAFGADLAITYLNEKSKPYTQQLAEALGVAPALYLPCDVREHGQVGNVIAAIEREWGSLQVLVHSIAFSPRDDLHGRVTDCSLPGFLSTMEISVWSLMHLAQLAEPLMAKSGGAIFTVSYFGGEKVVPHYGIMGPAKAALETAAKYMAAELGPKGIRVNVVSPGPVLTRAASGISRFDELLEKTKERAPTNTLVTPDQVGVATAVLACDYLKIITGEVLYMDGGYNIMG
ncbi:enoyl-ACP reductase FabI [Defluviicoccus vanus]|uniref:Enoyl-[acyl-carrier-protein] reductase [NADH] n=1 Tax=Defluviicoccus vanus TaxID=111831 RepID=A0A7H1N2M3_9PROT|nr:enoyl-ACP reductase FabI [Defluviicoccus vanus]QNT69959.1 enoyl-ACP reductase FabI [Defluviicoccus vanus]